jgi:cytochrome P450
MGPKIASIAGGASEGTRRLPFHKTLTLDIAASIFVGVDLGPGTQRMNQAFEDMVAASMSRIRLRLPGLEFYRGLVGREGLVRTFRELLPKKRSGDGADMFSRLCRAEAEDGTRLADQEIVDHMIFLMMAAHDTTTSALTSMTYELARHPEWQERVREEAFAFGKPHLGFDDLDSASQLGLVMKETLRRYPPLPVIPRVAEAEFSFEGYRIPAGAMVVVSPIHTHHMPEWFPAPHLFDPERFAEGRAEDQRHTHAWIPFGGGPHHCIGLRFAETQVKAIMHQLLRRFAGRAARAPHAGQRAPISGRATGAVRFSRSTRTAPAPHGSSDGRSPVVRPGTAHRRRRAATHTAATRLAAARSRPRRSSRGLAVAVVACRNTNSLRCRRTASGDGSRRRPPWAFSGGTARAASARRGRPAASATQEPRAAGAQAADQRRARSSCRCERT